MWFYHEVVRIILFILKWKNHLNAVSLHEDQYCPPKAWTKMIALTVEKSKVINRKCLRSDIRSYFLDWLFPAVDFWPRFVWQVFVEGLSYHEEGHECINVLPVSGVEPVSLPDWQHLVLGAIVVAGGGVKHVLVMDGEEEVGDPSGVESNPELKIKTAFFLVVNFFVTVLRKNGRKIHDER